MPRPGATGPSFLPCTAGPTAFTVSSMLAGAGVEGVIFVSSFRICAGTASTRFLSGDAIRNGQPSAIAVDIVALMDALKIEKAILAGYDWGARTADIIAALWLAAEQGTSLRQRGYLIGSREAGKDAAAAEGRTSNGGTSSISPPNAAAPATKKYRRDFTKLIWQIASAE